MEARVRVGVGLGGWIEMNRLFWTGRLDEGIITVIVVRYVAVLRRAKRQAGVRRLISAERA